jgi:hypothetical protein
MKPGTPATISRYRSGKNVARIPAVGRPQNSPKTSAAKRLAIVGLFIAHVSAGGREEVDGAWTNWAVIYCALLTKLTLVPQVMPRVEGCMAVVNLEDHCRQRCAIKAPGGMWPFALVDAFVPASGLVIIVGLGLKE